LGGALRGQDPGVPPSVRMVPRLGTISWLRRCAGFLCELLVAPSDVPFSQCPAELIANYTHF
jgi:hypothetical protein